MLDFAAGPGCPLATIERHDDAADRTTEAEVAMATVLEQVENYLAMMPNIPSSP